MTTTNTRIDLTLTTGTGRDEGHFEAKGIIFRVAGSNNVAGWGFGGWDESGEGREVMHGPMVKGPIAYLFGLAGVICNNGGTGAIHAEAEADGRLLDVAAGDVISVNGIDFVVSVCPRGYVYAKTV